MLRVVCGVDEALEFADAASEFRPFTPDDALRALSDAESALRDGAWIAGYFTYEFGAALHGSHRAAAEPLFVLGAFEAPRRVHLETTAPVSMSPLLPRTSPDAYARAMQTIARAIYDGDVYQVNYTVPFDFEIDGDAFALWANVARETGAAYQAYVEDGARRILSWSPELFLAFDKSRITTRPMKGTATYDAAGELDNEKNRAEHVMIVDLLCNDLRRIADNVTVEAFRTTERYPTLLTTTSTISGDLDEAWSLLDVFRATFPCGSITGAPKRAAIEHIAAVETHARGVYCGSVGYLSPQRRGWWNVAIRTAQFDGPCGRYDAGGGIVADSSAASEWDELLLKTAALAKHAEPLALLETFAAAADAPTLDAHLHRLERSASAWCVPFDRDRAFDAVNEARAAHSGGILRLRLHADGAVMVRHEAVQPIEEPVTICIAPERVSSANPLLQYKTSWRPHHARAAHYAAEHGCFDALLRNERGECTEGSRTNLFARIDGELVTPPCSSGLLPGILRSRIVTEGRARERALSVDDLVRAEAVYVGNSARGLLRARLRMESNE